MLRAAASERSQRTFITMKVRSSYCSASRIQSFISAESRALISSANFASLASCHNHPQGRAEGNQHRDRLQHDHSPWYLAVAIDPQENST